MTPASSDVPDPKRRYRMTNKEKAALLADGHSRCLLPLENIIDEAIQKKAFHLAEYWQHQYNGALKMLEALQLITSEECDARSEEMLSQLLRAQHPSAYEEKVV